MKKMDHRGRVIISISGGLGNQMFQYAMAKNYAVKNNLELYIDKSWYILNSKQRLFMLDKFNIKENIFPLKNIIIIKIIHILLPKIARILNITSFFNFVFDINVCKVNKAILGRSKPYWFIGYWQSEKYFLHSKKLLINTFSSTKQVPKEGFKEKLAIEKAINPICIHVRRGDYLNAKNINIYESFSLKYYIEAVEYIKKNVENPSFFIFSDDPVWATKNLEIKFSSPTYYVKTNSKLSPVDTLQLMSMCKHFIITNSTFGWWSAQISKNKDSIVIAPKRWYKNKKNLDIIPNNWIKF